MDNTKSMTGFSLFIAVILNAVKNLKKLPLFEPRTVVDAGPYE